MPVTEQRLPSPGWLLDTAPLRESPAYRRFWASGVTSGSGHRLTAVARLVQTAGPRVGDMCAGFLAAAAKPWWPPLPGAFPIGALVGALRVASPQLWDYDGRTPVP
ncbi:MAG: hypothetical protein ACK4MD_09195 [Demequina sp.]